jgi:glycosyltransferase involved in cell wall biosynthesis
MWGVCMHYESSASGFAVVVPSLNETAAQNEDIVQILLFAATKLTQALANTSNRSTTATIISVEHDTRGWKRLANLFPETVLPRISVEVLDEPAIPNLAAPASHKPAYNLFEYLKSRDFNEVHCLDQFGLAYYPTQAKQLGLYFLQTIFAVHIVGGTLFHKETENHLLDSLGALADDMLERGSLERADVIYVHDRKAWQWYSGKIELSPQATVHDLAWPETTPAMAESAEAESVEAVAASADRPLIVTYYGSLSAGDGLPFFCDAVGRALSNIKRPVEIYFIGSPQAVGGMDAVSYIRLRTAKWGVPVVIKRDLSIADELALIGELGGVVVYNTVRREGLRSRLIAGSGLRVLHICQAPSRQRPQAVASYPAIPGRVAQALSELATAEIVDHPRQTLRLNELWRCCRSWPADPTDIPSSPPLQMPDADQPRVSVCITHFSRPQKLRTALASLKRQTYRNFEVIVVDDGSPDPHVQSELIKIRQEIEPLGWRLIVQENRYLGAARNAGASHAAGDYLIFMDDDNAAMPNEISTFVAVAQRTGADIVTTFYDAFETERDLEGKRPAMRFTPFGSDPTLGILTNCFGDANALYSRQTFERLGGFTEDYGITHEDWEFFCRASLEGVKLVCVPEPLFWYRVDQNGMFRGEYTQLHKDANIRRHIRPFLEKLPYYQAKLVQLAQGLSTDLPLVTVGEQTRMAALPALRDRQTPLPYARVAVITRTKDRPLLLRRAIRSVLDQTFKDWLLVIVNDGGSPDAVELVVDAMADELNGRAVVLHHPVSFGMQTAANAGLSSCDSDFIIIHDDDDSWEPAFLARTVSHLDERGWNPRSGGVVTWARVIVEEIGEDGEVAVHDRYIFNSELRHLSLVDLAIENRFPPISFLFRRAALEVIGPFKEQHGVLGDWEFHLRLLRHFEIDVIQEPLANYHHRANSTIGVYGNSVHIQTDVHHLKRVELINGAVRGQQDDENGLPLPQLLALGELQHMLLEKQNREFQRLHDYIWTIENRVKYIASQFDRSKAPNYSRNLALNGDFRHWLNREKTHQGPGGAYVYSEICPGFWLCFDGRQVAYKAEQHKWTEDGQQLPFGKTFLHLENDAQTQGGSWFALECLIPSVLLLSGQNICISGLSRIQSSQDWIHVGGRYQLGDGRELDWPSQRVFLSTEFARWHCTITCPSVLKSALQRGHNARIILKLPYDQPFEFDLTDFQVEIGTAPTDFTYHGTLPFRQRMALLRDKARVWLKLPKASQAAADDTLNAKASA